MLNSQQKKTEYVLRPHNTSENFYTVRCKIRNKFDKTVSINF
jgi:hypothetical protein